MTKDDYSWSQHDLVDGNDNEAQEDNEDSVVHPGDIGIEVDTKQDHEVPSVPVTAQKGDIDEEVNVQLQDNSLQGKTIEIYMSLGNFTIQEVDENLFTFVA